MHITFAPRGILQIDDVRLTHKNFEGRSSRYNKEGERNFSIVIPDPELADKLMNDINEYGVGWNVKIKPPKDEDDEPFMYLPVKVKFNSRGPKVYLISGTRKTELDEEGIACLDNIDIERVRLDIRPYDDEGSFGPFRAAYLQSMEVTQKIDRFAAEYEAKEMNY